MLRVLFIIVWASVWVPLRRLLRGRRHPRWGLRFELLVDIVRSIIRSGIPATLGGRVERRLPSSIIAPGVQRELDHVIGEYAGMRAEHFTPSRWRASGPVWLYLHGGGYVMCHPGTHRDMVARFSRDSGARTVAINYRKAPEDPYPAALQDAVRAYESLLAEGVEAGKIIVGGDSAGGGLTLALLQHLRSQRRPLPAAAVLISPWCDLEGTGQSMVDNAAYDYLPAHHVPELARLYLGDHDPRDPLVSPIHADLTGLPPLCLLTGDAEVFHSEHLLLAEHALRDGVQVEVHVGHAMVHVWPMFATYFPGCRFGFVQVAKFVARYT